MSEQATNRFTIERVYWILWRWRAFSGTQAFTGLALTKDWAKQAARRKLL